jgi:hypothetical protein
MKCLTDILKERVILVRFWYVLPEDGPWGPKHVGTVAFYVLIKCAFVGKERIYTYRNARKNNN